MLAVQRQMLYDFVNKRRSFASLDIRPSSQHTHTHTHTTQRRTVNYASLCSLPSSRRFFFFFFPLVAIACAARCCISTTACTTG